MIGKPLVVRVFAEELRQRVVLFVRDGVIICSTNIDRCACIEHIQTCGVQGHLLLYFATFDSLDKFYKLYQKLFI